MDSQLQITDIINTLSSFAPRLFENQIKAANYLKNLLSQNHIPFTIEEFKTTVPRIITASLLADGQSIACASTSLVSGTINSNKIIVDSTATYSESNLPNLNYNGKSDAISRTSHYFVPSLAFSRTDLAKIQNAKTIKGEVIIEPTPHTSQNILVGNLQNPKNIIFTHFDSLEGGAMDNASGTAITLLSIIQNPNFLTKNLFVLSSDEELSLEKPNYWGVGYRDFESRHLDLLETCQKIYIVDGLGLTPAHVHQEVIDEYFPILNIDKYLYKTFALSCTEESQWAVYHSPQDTTSNLNPKYLTDTLDLLNQLLS